VARASLLRRLARIKAWSRFYNEKANSHLPPYFGARRLTDIGTLEIQVFLNQKALKYSGSGLQHMKATLSRMFSDAVAWNFVRDNPVRNVRLPNARLAPPQSYLTPEQVRRLVFALRELYRTIVLTAVLTGLRPSELFGLYWTDLDFEKQTMQISHSYYMGEFGLPTTDLHPQIQSSQKLASPGINSGEEKEYEEGSIHGRADHCGIARSRERNSGEGAVSAGRDQHRDVLQVEEQIRRHGNQ
jgi:integrase